MASILVVEDDAAFRELLALHLSERGHAVRGVRTLTEARRTLGQARPDALLLDFMLPDGEGMALLEECNRTIPELPVILITGVTDNSLAIESMKAGAYDFIRKPLDVAELDASLQRALHLRRGSAGAALTLDGNAAGRGVVGRSPAIVDVCKAIGRVAGTAASVLITGESGTGKEVVARAIHEHSGRRGAFLPVNCAALVDTLLESELFGHEKGSFTGAVVRTDGKFQQATDGTLFLDEISEMPLPLQAKLLRVLQEGVLERVGGSERIPTSARIVAASNRDLAGCVRDREFRKDLFYRLNVMTLHLPPLRERREDIPVLVEHLLERINGKLGKEIGRVSEAAMRNLLAHAWPGNVRELENALTRAAVLAHGDTLTPDLFDLPPDGPAPTAPASAPSPLLSLEEMEAWQVRAVLAHTAGHRGKACAILRISRPALERKIRKYHLA